MHSFSVGQLDRLSDTGQRQHPCGFYFLWDPRTTLYNVQMRRAVCQRHLELFDEIDGNRPFQLVKFVFAEV